MFNHRRLSLARKRRRLTGKGLAEATGLSPVTITRLEKGTNVPDPETVRRIADVLQYPPEFFEGDDPEPIDTAAASFRSLTRMTAKERDAALAAGSLGVSLNRWAEAEFNMPAPQLLDLSFETDAETAARSLRQHFGIGVKPISNMIRLLEAHGVRVFSLSEQTANVDAFSFWRDETPFVFLNNFKTAEHAVFDAAHELGHLVLHRHGGVRETRDPRQAEQEANRFASAFLMPRDDVRPRMPRMITISVILEAKKRWRVSAMALAYRLHSLRLLSDWQYKSLCIELGRRGYRRSEVDGIEREQSAIWPKLFAELWRERTTKAEVAKQLAMPLDELESLVWGVAGDRTRSPGSLGGFLEVVK